MLLKLKLDSKENNKHKFIPTYLDYKEIKKYFSHIYNNTFDLYSQKMHVIYNKNILLKIDEKCFSSIDPISLYLEEESLFIKVLVEGRTFWAESKYFEEI